MGKNCAAEIKEKGLHQQGADAVFLPFPYSPSQWRTWTYPTIDGANEILRAITATGDQEKSLLLWHELLEIIKRECDWRQDFNDLLTGKCDYF